MNLLADWQDNPLTTGNWIALIVWCAMMGGVVVVAMVTMIREDRERNRH